MARKRRFRFGLPIIFAGRLSVGGVGLGCQLIRSAAAAEFGAQFRSDVESFVTREAMDAVVVPGRFELEYCYRGTKGLRLTLQRRRRSSGLLDQRGVLLGRVIHLSHRSVDVIDAA